MRAKNCSEIAARRIARGHPPPVVVTVAEHGGRLCNRHEARFSEPRLQPICALLADKHHLCQIVEKRAPFACQRTVHALELPVSPGLWGRVYARRTPSDSSGTLNSPERYPGPLPVITCSTATPRPVKSAGQRAMNPERSPPVRGGLASRGPASDLDGGDWGETSPRPPRDELCN